MSAQALERKGFISDRCELNRQIKADNKLLRELKAQVAKLKKIIIATIPGLANAMEMVRQNILIFHYQLFSLRAGKKSCSDTLEVLKPGLEKYRSIVGMIKRKTTERKELIAEKKALPVIKFIRRKELSTHIAKLTEELEELRSEKLCFLKT